MDSRQHVDADGRQTGRHSPYETPLRNDYWESYWKRKATGRKASWTLQAHREQLCSRRNRQYLCGPQICPRIWLTGGESWLADSSGCHESERMAKRLILLAAYGLRWEVTGKEQAEEPKERNN